MAYKSLITAGYMTKLNNGSVLCEIIPYVEGFSSHAEEETDQNKFFFMVDLRKSDFCSTKKTTVAHILSDLSKCDKDIKSKLFCEDLKDLESSCADKETLVCKRKQCEIQDFYAFGKAAKKCLYSSNVKSPVGRNFILEHCKKDYGGSLISINSEEENSEIAILSGTFGALIGLHVPEDAAWSENSFAWLDGSTSAYRNWADGYPKEGKGNFVYMHGSETTQGHAGKWTNFEPFQPFELLKPKEG
ncbi:hypothetical protein L596_027445 [Steinernema carpocapsae]|uniref:C-type lectin domain-containing protein n=1 Tax=Steinernema carpocapsae TaxID=34508 RepID=A0A4U5M4B3_STECR|nr:hypothetical protein L596_027445 [Steinernema carpocapsae]